MHEVMLRIEGVSKSIGQRTLLEPCSFQVPKGGILALCGGNGAGKSTLIRIIAGLSQPSSGKVYLSGISWLEDRKRYADSMGYMPDDFHFGAALTAYETLRFYASLRGADDRRIMELLALVGLTEVRNRRISTFSKGMRQRLLFAQAMLAKPDLLLLDEPTNGLDPYWMDAFGALILQASVLGQTIVFSTHQLNIAEQIADQVVLMDAGYVRYAGDAKLLKDKYRENGGLYGAFQELIVRKAAR